MLEKLGLHVEIEKINLLDFYSSPKKITLDHCTVNSSIMTQIIPWMILENCMQNYVLEKWVNLCDGCEEMA